MKELFKHNKLSERQQIESIVKKKKDIEFKFESSINPKRGHKVWEINLKTMEINLAKFVVKKEIYWKDALLMIKGGFRKDIVINTDCVYISSLNKSSALERLKMDKGSSVIPKGMLKLK